MFRKKKQTRIYIVKIKSLTLTLLLKEKSNYFVDF